MRLPLTIWSAAQTAKVAIAKTEPFRDTQKEDEVNAHLITASPDLLKMCILTIGFCVDFRQNKDWENHPEVGLLFALAKKTLAKAEPK